MPLPSRRRAHRIGTPGRTPWRRRALAGLSALLLSLPGAAYPITLSQLLRWPLEALLLLEISRPADEPGLRPGASAQRPAGDWRPLP